MTLSLPWADVASLEVAPTAARAARLALTPLLAASRLSVERAEALQSAVAEAVGKWISACIHG